ncbi:MULTISPECIES: N-acetylmuramoyl-L-alanine amidase [Morganella]|uniref:N-acetylmuramoyl-L-alanine amidase n=1 Tax=Morganella TaxID=581 RepID=UPI000404DABA|nr:N-acetylmuramoyl-L-alanine amidase [Morganella morganii]EKW3935767.1 N-acetylmuramoyl-L-alanine amidase [Morganella morganii]EKW3938484.1 N-acetylmuramoyl-L-alanine amidase [Morganella morganii]MBT0309224.1 N-acetylmuramoyl-L-alanine amidase [Morganella morganii subsp. morganii]MBT0315773.1 N-acetylmuramoyl-L-alanine amidase [Morganella morganii subsp. morganii]MBT0368879.1 N-acetylmuramoyl-L-alanine amidase [Morganella morganii subsp. morganii]
MNAYLTRKSDVAAVSWLTALFFCVSLLFSAAGHAASLTGINVNNNGSQGTLQLSFDGKPQYKLFPLHDPERLVIDIRQPQKITGLPINLNNGLIKVVRESRAPDAQHQRIVLELADKNSFRDSADNSGLTITLTGKNSYSAAPVAAAQPVTTTSGKPLRMNSGSAAPAAAAPAATTPAAAPAQAKIPVVPTGKLPKNSRQVVVAIDAGHGGKDPGAIGQNGLKEKNVTISIARKLEKRLKDDPMFKPVLTRDGDYFISVAGRSEVARKFGSNMLVSIHADSAPNRTATGSSVWVLSNRRANNELGNWLEQSEKQSELLGGAGDALANGADPYLSQAVLDLQFGNSQRVGYAVAQDVIRQLRQIGKVHKGTPEHASLGVLRSPDIPSILVETGFISNSTEEQLLGSDTYQEQVAAAIHGGLRAYFTANPLQAAPSK